MESGDHDNATTQPWWEEREAWTMAFSRAGGGGGGREKGDRGEDREGGEILK